jgi:hypothetical protein
MAKIPKGKSESLNRRTDNTMAKIPKGKLESLNGRRTESTMAIGKRTNNEIPNIAQKPKYRAMRTPLKTRNELRCSGRVNGP